MPQFAQHSIFSTTPKTLNIIANYDYFAFPPARRTWDPMDTLNITRLPKEAVEANRANIMANRTFVVALLMNDPYTMLRLEVMNNDRRKSQN